MLGPEGEEHWALADYTSISPKTNFKFLDAFCDAMLAIAEEAKTNPDLLHNAPHSLAIGRLDEAHAAKCLNLCWRSSDEEETTPSPLSGRGLG